MSEAAKMKMATTGLVSVEWAAVGVARHVGFRSIVEYYNPED